MTAPVLFAPALLLLYFACYCQLVLPRTASSFMCVFYDAIVVIYMYIVVFGLAFIYFVDETCGKFDFMMHVLSAEDTLSDLILY